MFANQLIKLFWYEVNLICSSSSLESNTLYSLKVCLPLKRSWKWINFYLIETITNLEKKASWLKFLPFMNPHNKLMPV